MAKAYIGWGDWVQDGAAVVTASSTASGFTPQSLAIDDPGLWWYAADGDTTPWIRIDLGAQVEVGDIAVIGAAPVGPTWRARLSTSSPSGSSGLVIDSGTAATRYDASYPLLAYTPPTPRTGRYLVIDGVAAAGRVRAGRTMTPEGNYSGFSSGYRAGHRSFSLKRATDGGTLVGSRGPQPRRWAIPFRQVMRDQVFGEIADLFRVNGPDLPVVICLDRAADPIGRMAMYATMNDDPPDVVNLKTVYHELVIEFTEVLYRD